MNNDQKILITGGAGFIGQSLVKKFQKSKHEVCVLDINTSCPIQGRYIKSNVLDFERLVDVVKEHDIIIHFVGLADAKIAQEEPAKSFELNVVSLQKILEACRISGGDKKLIFPSSSAIYGLVDVLPIREDFPLRPTNIYSWHKYICEKMIKAFHNNFGLKYVILRLFNVYGRGNKGVINFFLRKAEKKELIESFGPYQYRDFIYVGDVVDAFYKSAIYEKANNKIVNIGSGKGIQIKEILDIICEIYPGTKWIYKKEKFIIYDSIADITFAKILLDFKPHSSKNFLKKIIMEEIMPADKG
ncbi:MAG: NAD-dependent epimerase/dehydratase family protein [Candidatus Bathyarchaeota archaeon]|nr:NAD-dependent epimerase/dehydratase family protein [Candidatus Bathyarchaeota archaeon]MCZ2845470.1 NAD-dependent epimerase/dehydratase family protein [Candidatus Bathyarchaeota archaeon]